MIGWLLDQVVALVVTPQATVTDPDRRAALDPDAAPIDATPQTLEVLALTTRPIAYEIGNGLELRHEIAVALVVEHGDPAVARALRDAILTDLVLRLLDARDALMAAVDPTSGQYLSRLDFSISYIPLEPDTPNEYGVLTITADATLDR